MLCLTRKAETSVVIDNGRIVVKVLSIRGDKVRLGFVAAEDVPIFREEVQQAIDHLKTKAE